MYGINVLFRSRVVSIQSRYYSSSSSKKLLEILADMPKPNSARIASAQRQRQKISKKSEKYGPSTVYLQVLGSGAKGAPNTLYLFTDQKRYMFNCGECTQRLAHEHKVRLSKLDHIFITTRTWKNIGGLPGLSLTLQDVGVPNITLHGPPGLDELYNATKRFVIMKDMNVTMAKCTPAEDFEDNVMTVKYVLLENQNENILEPHNLTQTSKKPKSENKTDQEFAEFFHDETDYYRADRNSRIQPDKDKAKSKSKPSSYDTDNLRDQKILQTLQKDDAVCSVAYICTLKKRLGTLDLVKCVERGVKPGPLLGQLKNGFDVILPNGDRVYSRDVKTPDDPGPVFIVLDVPDVTYIKEEDFQPHFNNGVNPPENIPVLIVHFTQPHVLDNPDYTNFIAKFGPTTQHLVLNSNNSCLGSEAVHRTQHKLHLLDADIFPLLRDVSVPAVWNAQSSPPKTNNENDAMKLKGLEELKNKIALAQFQNIISLEGSGHGDSYSTPEAEGSAKLDLVAGRTLTMFHLRPKMQLDRSAEPKLHIQDYIQETMDVEGFIDSKQKFKNLVENIKYSKSYPEEYPRVVFLGTGSCIPSKTRNTSAIMVHVDEGRSILLDCGEGTFGQLVRFYGPKKVNAVLRTLKAIYISHLHADHHIGLIGVLQGRRQAFEELKEDHLPVYLLAPGQIMSWLTLYDSQFEPIKGNYTLVPNQCLLAEPHRPNPSLTSAALSAMGVLSVQTCLVPHCPNAFGVAIQMYQHKLTYSGDTLPCTDLVAIGENSTLLIHEATMEDALAEEARTKMHSTTSQAIEIGQQMNARFTVLTHFSQRYARLPRLNTHILHNNHSVGIAFDNMQMPTSHMEYVSKILRLYDKSFRLCVDASISQITMDDLKVLPHMYAPLQLMFAEHCVDMELKAAHREQQREKRESSPTSHAGQRLRNLKKQQLEHNRRYRTPANRQEVKKETEPKQWVSYTTHVNTLNLRQPRTPTRQRLRNLKKQQLEHNRRYRTPANRQEVKKETEPKQWVSYTTHVNTLNLRQPRTPTLTPHTVKPVPPTRLTQPQPVNRQPMAAGRQPRQCSAQRTSPLRSRSCSSARNYIGHIPTKLKKNIMDTFILPPELPEPQQIKPSTQDQPLQSKQTKQSCTRIPGFGVRSRSCCSSGNRRRNTFGTKDLYLNLGQALLQKTPKNVKHSLTKPTHSRPTRQLPQAQRTLKQIVHPNQPQNVKKSSPVQLSRQLSGQSLPDKVQYENTRRLTPERPVRLQNIQQSVPEQTPQSSSIQPIQSNNVKQAPIQSALPHYIRQSSSSVNQARQATHQTQQQLTEQMPPAQPIHPHTRHLAPKLTRLSSPIRPTHPQQPKMPTLTTRKVSRLSSPLRPIAPRVTRLLPVQPTQQQRSRLPSPTRSTHPQAKQSSPVRFSTQSTHTQVTVKATNSQVTVQLSPVQPTHPQVTVHSSFVQTSHLQVTVPPTHPQFRKSKQMRQKKPSENSKEKTLNRPSSSSINRQDSPQLTPSECETIILCRDGSTLTSANEAQYRAIGTSYEDIQIPSHRNIDVLPVKEELTSRKTEQPPCTPKSIENHKVQPASVTGYSNTKIPVSKNSPKPLKASLISNKNLHVSNTENSKEPLLQECIHEEYYGAIFENEIDIQKELKSKLATNKFPAQPLRTTVMHSKIKDFKPQLEEIQSSYLLLNEQQQATKVSDIKPERKKGPKPDTNTTRFDEKSRVQLLQESKQKFKTKQFFADSRYEKIEGLNWISW